MRTTWQLQKTLLKQNWTEEEVLLEFNGPQLALFRGNEGLYLGVASDEDEEHVRWLRSPISPTELKGLRLGATTVRNCLLKPGLVVVDTDFDGNPVVEFDVDWSRVDDRNLPKENSFLPTELIRSYTQRVPKPLFVLNGPTISGHAIGFKLLGEVSNQIQRLWNAIGQSLSGQPTAKGSIPADILSKTEIRAANLIPGSVGIEVEVADTAFFELVAKTYAELLSELNRAKSVPSSPLLSELKARVRSAFSDYLQVLYKNRVEVLTQWNDHAAFVSPYTASRISTALEYVGNDEEEFSEVGNFSGFSIEHASFEFQPNGSDVIYKGRVSTGVLKKPDLSITISRDVEYSATFHLLTWVAQGREPKVEIILEDVELLRASDISTSG